MGVSKFKERVLGFVEYLIITLVILEIAVVFPAAVCVTMLVVLLAALCTCGEY